MLHICIKKLKWGQALQKQRLCAKNKRTQHFHMLNVKNFALPFLLILFLLPTLFVKLVSIWMFDSHVRPVCPIQSFSANYNFKENCNVRYDKAFGACICG